MIEFVETEIEQLVETSKTLIESHLGRKISAADPLILLLRSLLSIIVQQRELINYSGQQNLLMYAAGENLEALGALVGITRQSARAAITTMRLELSSARAKETVVPAGTRISTAEGVHFKLSEDAVFLVGETVKSARAECMEAGESGNNFGVGEISKIVDYAPYLKHASNITQSEGGADIESDESLRERIRIAPESYSVAGSSAAYEFWAKNFNTDIIDVAATSPKPGYVDVYVLMKDGVPHEEILNALQRYLSDEKLRPLTDFLTVKPPEVLKYVIEARYWVNRSDATRVAAIITNVESALAEYEKWQRSKLGRDLNASELIWRLKSAGVKRVEVREPLFTKVAAHAVMMCEGINVTYQGLEDE